MLRVNVQEPLQALARPCCVWRRKQAVLGCLWVSAVCTGQVLVRAVSLNPSRQVFPKLRYSGVFKVAWIEIYCTKKPGIMAPVIQQKLLSFPFKKTWNGWLCGVTGELTLAKACAFPRCPAIAPVVSPSLWGSINLRQAEEGCEEVACFVLHLQSVWHCLKHS